MDSNIKTVRKTPMLAALLTWGTILPSRKGKSQEKPIISGSPMSPTIDFRFAVYMLPSAAKDPQIALSAAIVRCAPNLRRIADIPEKPIEMVVKVQLLKNAVKGFPPPTPEDLKYSDSGLSKAAARALQRSKQVFMLEFAHPREKFARRCVRPI